MVDSRLPVSGSSLSTHFAQKAVMPQREAEEAVSFATTLETQLANGSKPTPEVIGEGERILRRLNEKTETFVFNFAQVVSAGLAQDEAARIAAVESGLNTAEQAGKRLRDALKKLG